jgi:hypothetical protein
MRNIIDENEVKRILMMHKALMEQEETTTSTQVEEKTPYDILNEYKSVKCLANGVIYKDHPTKKGDMGKYFYRGVKQSTKQEIDFFADMTYEFVDGSKSGTWKCGKISNTENPKDLESRVNSAVKIQTPDKSNCRTTINTFYDTWENKVDMDDDTFNELRQQVQTCVNHYREDWGGLLNLGPLKKKVDILTGNVMGTGPSRRGPDSKWRLS